MVVANANVRFGRSNMSHIVLVSEFCQYQHQQGIYPYSVTRVFFYLPFISNLYKNWSFCIVGIAIRSVAKKLVGHGFERLPLFKK